MRSNYDTERKELVDLGDSLHVCSLDFYRKVFVEVGRPLQPGEFQVELHLLVPEDNGTVELCDDCLVSDRTSFDVVREAMFRHLERKKAADHSTLKDVTLPTDPKWYVACGNVKESKIKFKKRSKNKASQQSACLLIILF